MADVLWEAKLISNFCSIGMSHISKLLYGRFTKNYLSWLSNNTNMRIQNRNNLLFFMYSSCNKWQTGISDVCTRLMSPFSSFNWNCWKFLMKLLCIKVLDSEYSFPSCICFHSVPPVSPVAVSPAAHALAANDRIVKMRNCSDDRRRCITHTNVHRRRRRSRSWRDHDHEQHHRKAEHTLTHDWWIMSPTKITRSQVEHTHTRSARDIWTCGCRVSEWFMKVGTGIVINSCGRANEQICSMCYFQ